MPETTVYLKNYQPPVFSIEQVDLDFDLYDTHAIVKNHMQIKRQHLGSLTLHGDELQLVSVHLNDIPLTEAAYFFSGQDLIIPDCPDEFSLTIVTRIYPQNNTKLSGLYRSNQMFCTQCEAEGFRRMTYFPDRPDVLSIYTTRICADRETYPVLLSNGNLVDEGIEADGRHWVVWHDPFKKPSYLFALVAGSLACVRDSFTTSSGKHVDLRIYVEPGNEDKCDYAMVSLKKAMRWDEEVYGREYDLSIFMIVAVSDFNMGAMENKGLNIFNSKYILARPDTATDQDFAGIESVVAHEYFHNWTGNRVTCRDWFQLSLKEGLTVFRDQEFSRDMNSRDVDRIQDVKVLRATQFPEDAGSMAHPVRPDSYQEINNFYTATIYNKGAEVIRMQHTLLGSEGFRRGMDLYFERFDGQAVTIEDFVEAMEDANQVDFAQLRLWYSQAGTPEVEAAIDYSNQRLSVTLKQHCPPTPECQNKMPFLIPIRIALFDKQGVQLPLNADVLAMEREEQTFIFEGLSARPTVSLLRDFSAPIILKREYIEADVLALLRHETNGYAKWDASQQLSLNCHRTFLVQNESEWQIPQSLIDAMRHVLQDESLDESLRAEILTPPGFEELITGMERVDVERVERVRKAFRRQLGEALYDNLQAAYETLWAQEDNAIDGKAFGRRRLRNECLFLMMNANEHAALSLCEHQYRAAKTMTDQLSSFSLLNNCTDKAIRHQAVKIFYEQWFDDELVMDKWFTVQACGEHADTLDTVKALLDHKAFSLKNPNKVRSLVGAFCQANHRNFHAADGEGYAFLGDMLCKLDLINPQIAARLATPFTRWQRYDAPRQALMLEQLNRLAARDLSRDLREVVDKSLKI